MNNKLRGIGRVRIILRAATIAFMFLLSGCGYSVHRHSSLPFTEISIGTFENATLEPKLQDKLYRALTEEFLKQGIEVTPAAQLKLSGVINEFDMTGLSEKNDIIAEYRIVVNIEFRVLDDKGSIKEKKVIKSPFIVSVTGSPDLGMLLATKEAAEEKAMADIAMELAGELIYK